MIIWLLKDGENLPGLPETRKMRMWMLAEELTKRGHSVTWWSSTFSHQQKRLLAAGDATATVEPGFVLNMIYAGGYRRNLSLARLIHHSRLSRRFGQLAKKTSPPDAIVCAFPIIDLAYQAALHARALGIPILIDIRDKWPVSFLPVSPRPLKPLVKLFVLHNLRKTRTIFNNASRLVAVSKGFLDWAKLLGCRPAESPDQVFHIGYPVPIDQEDNQVSEKMLLLRDKVRGKTVFTYVGSFGHFYELELIVEVARRFQQDGLKNIHFVLSGDGERYRTIEKQANGLTNLTLTGWLDRHEISRLLRLSHVGLMPYFHFGDGTIPNKPFEYFANALPVLSSLQGDMREIIAEHDLGFTYRSGDVQELYRLIRRLSAETSLREHLGGNAKRVFDQQFRADVIYGRYADYIEAMIKTGGNCAQTGL